MGLSDGFIAGVAASSVTGKIRRVLEVAMSRRRIGVLALLFMTAACGSGDDDAFVTTAGAGPEVTPAATAESLEVVPVEAAPCDLLTAADVEAATGLSVVEVIDDPPLSCTFDLGEAAGVDVFVTIEDGQGRLAGPAAVYTGYADLVAAGTAEAIEGVGDGAYYSPDFRGLVIDAGDGRFVGVGVNGSFNELAEPRDVLVAMAQLVLGRL